MHFWQTRLWQKFNVNLVDLQWKPCDGLDLKSIPRWYSCENVLSYCSSTKFFYKNFNLKIIDEYGVVAWWVLTNDEFWKDSCFWQMVLNCFSFCSFFKKIIKGMSFSLNFPSSFVRLYVDSRKLRKVFLLIK
jgi:hypothetical protein